MNKVLLVDSNIQKMNIALTSKCDCCCSTALEDINHVPLEGEVATYLWNYFASIIGMRRGTDQRWVEMISWWFKKANIASESA